jgi:hypothetical protein
MPDRPDHHFVFDHAKWVFYAATATPGSPTTTAPSSSELGRRLALYE